MPGTSYAFAPHLLSCLAVALLAPAHAGGLQRPNFDLGPFSSPSFIASQPTLPTAAVAVAAAAAAPPPAPVVSPSSLAAQHAPVPPVAAIARHPITVAREKKLADYKASASKDAVADLGVGRDFEELDQVYALLGDILTGLAAQDTSDDNLLAAKQNNETVAISNTVSANATLATAVTTLADTTSALAVAETELVQAQTEETHSIAAGQTETTFVQAMQTALTSLQAVEPGVVALQVSQMASKLQARGVLDADPTTLLGRSYSEQVTSINSGLTALTTKIEEHNTLAAANTAAKLTTRDASNAAKTAASEAKIIAEAMRNNAIAQQAAATADLAETTTLVANSKTATEGLRTSVNTIQSSLEAFANMTGIISLQVGDSEGRFDYAKTQITGLLLTMTNTLDNEYINEVMDKQAKYSAFTSAGTVLSAKSSVYDAKQATLDTKDADISVALANKNSAVATYDDEVASQGREETVLADLEAALSGLTTNLATAVGTVKGPVAGGSQALIGQSVVNIQMQAQRSHNDFASQFQSLLATLRANMDTVKATKQADMDAKTTIHTNEVDSRPPILAERDDAYNDKVAQEADVASKLSMYNTATDKLLHNEAIREQERTTIEGVRTILDSIA